MGSAGWNRFSGRYLKPVCESEESPAAPQSCQYNTRVYFNTPSHPSDDMGLYVDGDHGDMDPSGLIWAELTNPRAGGRAGAGLSLQRSTKRYSLWTNESIDGDRVDRVWVEDDALCGGKLSTRDVNVGSAVWAAVLSIRASHPGAHMGGGGDINDADNRCQEHGLKGT